MTITPTSGLVTIEAGGTATFSVVLTSQPTANVTVTLVSSNTAEGTVPASILFTPANWNVSQNVTITGVNDNVDDGNIAYSIVTAVQSSDPLYAAINPADVSVTNTDNDTAFPAALIFDTVNDNDDGNYAAGNLSLREAVLLANDQPGAQTITFSAALAGQTITLTQGRIAIVDSLTISGLGAAKLKISGNSASQIFFIDGAASPITVAIQDVALENGRASGAGGTTLGGFNTAANGGVIANFGGSVTLNRVQLAHNTATFGDSTNGLGGSVFNGPNSALTLLASTLTDNFASTSGGGISTQAGSTLSVINSTLSGNLANQSGGGIHNAQGTLTLVNSTVVLNRANADDTLQGSESGGGLHSTGVDSFVNSILAGNLLGSGAADDDLFLQNTPTVANNNLIGTDGPFRFAGGTGNIVGSPSIALGSILDPTLRDNGGATMTHALAQNSLAIAAASASAPGCSTYDQPMKSNIRSRRSASPRRSPKPSNPPPAPARTRLLSKVCINRRFSALPTPPDSRIGLPSSTPAPTGRTSPSASSTPSRTARTKSRSTTAISSAAALTSPASPAGSTLSRPERTRGR